MRVTLIPSGRTSRARYMAVASPSRFGLVQRITSLTSSGSSRAQQFSDLQLIRADTLDRVERAVQDVVSAAELLGLLDGHDVARVFDHTQQRLIAPRVSAHLALTAFCNVEATSAECDVLLYRDDGVGKPCRILGRNLQQMERQALRGLRTDPRKATELVDQGLKRP